jgi:hypothetical protein
LRYYRTLVVGGAALFLCFQASDYGADVPSTSPKDPTAAPSLELVWKRAVSPPACLASSPDGNYIAVVGKAGSVRCFGEDGRPVWEVHLPGADRVAVGPDGSALAYSFLNPTNDTLHFIGPDGKVRWRQRVQGAIWAAAASPEPGNFAVGTGERYCYVYAFSRRRHRYRRWRLPGAPCTVSFSPDGQSLTFGTWQDSGVGTFSLNGRQIAWSSGDGDRLYSVELCSSGEYAVVTARPNRSAPGGSIYLKNAKLDDLWRKELAVHNLTADIAPTGQYVAVGYQRAIMHKNEEILENRIALYNRSGQMLWQKGGLFGKWDLLQICPSGELLVYDESASMYLLSQSGKILQKRRLSASVRKFATNPARERVAVYCRDGQLCVFAIR